MIASIQLKETANMGYRYYIDINNMHLTLDNYSYGQPTCLISEHKLIPSCLSHKYIFTIISSYARIVNYLMHLSFLCVMAYYNLSHVEDKQLYPYWYICHI